MTKENERLPKLVVEWLDGAAVPAGALRKALADKLENDMASASEILNGVKGCFDAPDSVLVPRARYNYLLELEHDAHDFASKFAEWGE